LCIQRYAKVPGNLLLVEAIKKRPSMIGPNVSWEPAISSMAAGTASDRRAINRNRRPFHA
jgi:hypothetical protein